jgi:hypothetical protein
MPFLQRKFFLFQEVESKAMPILLRKNKNKLSLSGSVCVLAWGDGVVGAGTENSK